MTVPHIVAFGGGVDSTAMIIGLIEQRRPIDLILFADTGGERPHTYDHIDNFSKWLVGKGYPEIITVKRVRKDGSLETLEEECHRRVNLPSIAYGFKSCSQKHKIAPQDKYLNSWQPAKDAWSEGLGRRFSWVEIIKAHDSQMELPFCGFDLPCECTE